MTFQKLGITEEFVKALTENNITTPSPIQKEAIPFLLTKGTDFIGQAQTGTGKTIAFGLPILQKIDPTKPKIQALVLSPTRELSIQIAKQLFRLTKYSAKIFSEAVYGGEKIDLQIDRLRRPTHIVVATPGRLIDLLEKKAIDLSHVQTVVLDEADEMLSMGFKDQLDKILEFTGKKRNTWLFSATMSDGIKRIIKNYMDPNAFQVQIGKAEVVNTNIEHKYVISSEFQKLDFLAQFLKSQGTERGIVFCKTKMAVKALVDKLSSKNFSIDAIHGDLMQKERDKVMRAFQNNKLQILVATDISARGIDVANLAYVAHYELPDQIEYYTHRSGRTARAGKQGLSICFVTEKEVKYIKEIEKALNIKIKQIFS